MQMFSALTNMGIFTYALIAFVVLTIIHEILLFSCCKGQNGIDEARFAKALGRLKKRQAVSGSSKAQ